MRRTVALFLALSTSACITPLEPQPPGKGEFYIVDLGAHVTPNAINEVTQVVGKQYVDGRNVAVQWSSGTLTQLFPDSDASSEAFDINDRGNIVGEHNTRPFRILNGTLSVGGFPDGSGRASSINENNQVLASLDEIPLLLWQGSSVNSQVHGVGRLDLGGLESQYSCGGLRNEDGTWEPGLIDAYTGYAHLFQPLPMEPYRVGMALDYDPGSDVAVGLVMDFVPPYRYAARWTAGVFEVLGRGRATAINSSGRIVGLYYPSGAALWIGNSRIDLNDWLDEDSDWFLSMATDINDQGEIVGYGRRNGVSHGFLLRRYRPYELRLDPREDGLPYIVVEGLPKEEILIEFTDGDDPGTSELVGPIVTDGRGWAEIEMPIKWLVSAADPQARVIELASGAPSVRESLLRSDEDDD